MHPGPLASIAGAFKSLQVVASSCSMACDWVWGVEAGKAPDIT